MVSSTAFTLVGERNGASGGLSGTAGGTDGDSELTHRTADSRPWANPWVAVGGAGVDGTEPTSIDRGETAGHRRKCQWPKLRHGIDVLYCEILISMAKQPPGGEVELPARTLGDWKLIKEVTRGGQGVIYEAISAVEGAQVVILKELRATSSQARKAERIRREIEAHKKLYAAKVENIMPILDSSVRFDEETREVQGYLVMPRCPCSLRDVSGLVRRRLELCLEIFAGICTGVAAAHSLGLIHRDLKPENVLFLDEDLRIPVVSDFGIALDRISVDERVTEVGESVGARYFMAPEQEVWDGSTEINESADVYAAAKILHFMLTGRYLSREKLDRAFNPGELRRDPRLTEVMDLILRPCITAEPSKRIQDIATVLERVEGMRLACTRAFEEK